MNPWGLMEGSGAGNERARLAGVIISDTHIRQLLRALTGSELPAGSVQLRSAPFNGEFAMLSYDAESRVTRVNGSSLRGDTLSDEDWSGLAGIVRPDLEVFSAGWIDNGDAYYFSHHDEARFPVWRIVFDDPQQTRYYFAAHSAELVSKVDANRRWYRWLFLALHRADFSQWMRSRPTWDLVLLPLLFGAAVGAVTGTYLGIRRLRRQKL
jgi:hypothetical protein